MAFKVIHENRMKLDKALEELRCFMESSDIKDDLKKVDYFQEVDEGLVKYQMEITKFQEDVTLNNATLNTVPMAPGAPSADASGVDPGKERYINRPDKLVTPLPYEATSLELSNCKDNYEGWCSCSFPDSGQDEMTPAEMWSKLDSRRQNELDKDKFKGLSWVKGKKVIRDRHSVLFPPQSIQVVMLCLSRGGKIQPMPVSIHRDGLATG